MNEDQKERKITYLLSILKDSGQITRDGESKQLSNWILKNDAN